ncbi:rhodanese-like domain-containing protein [Rossellomorea aquimaris]|uniref:Rhodanese-like domain-containing protein n=1 Tax=Rossellomorea aquimaris TaxID=189382 RepID=A0A5D4TVC3_9BACI|nr:rhodanese-like domain-containing protein [Rossellomorea aquimaris]TYS78076.1 rhodanese-like domain-containing protein [Rossellomorea aquimaris]
MLTLLTIGLIACSSVSQDELTNENAKQMIDNGDVKVLDVRSEEEYLQGHIKGRLFILTDVLQSRLDELDKNQSFLVVCRPGCRSSQAAKVLKSYGFTSLYNLQSGLIA